ncbi:MAG: SusC/RagA family TonB-linked outer membrane protein [Muribaculaceae bacterium]|nr:SusC/RagA family TonB-linked outer membrane protein [Muribaculaceae bacterium]
MNSMSRWGRVMALAAVLAAPLLAMHAVPPPVSQPVMTRPATEQAAGVVVDENGEPLIGATVAVIGTGVTTATDVDGHFTLPLPAGDCMLQFTYVGYAAQKLAPGPQMHVQMMPGNNALSEVVVTALGIKREAKALSYHVQQVENDAIMRVQDANFVNSLTGKLAGVQINANASGIGGSSRVVMRGTKSIDGNNNVLYVIDGVPLVNAQSGLDDDALAFSGSGQTGDATAMLNPDDIESISALTGPSAAALYGSDAANGVILITTKKGAAGRTEVTYNGSFQFSRPLRLPEFQNTYGQTEAGSYYSWGDRLAAPSDYNPADFFRTATNLTNAISLSTGNDRNQTYVSLAATNAGGIIHNNDLDRYNVSARNTTKAFGDRVTLDLSYMLSSVKENNMISQGQYFNPLVPLYLFPAGADWTAVQYFERYDADRNFAVQYWPYGRQAMSMQNPYWITERNNFVNHKVRNTVSAVARWDITDWLALTGRARYDNNDVKHESKLAAGTDLQFASKYGHYGYEHRQYRQYFVEAFATINKYWDQNRWSLSAVLGTNYDKRDERWTSFDGHLAQMANIYSLRNVVAGGETKYDQGAAPFKKLALYGSAQLGYRSMAYLDVTARNDWSSKLANAQESYFYWSAGLSGIITEMIPAMRSQWLNYLKLRLSYAEVGNDPWRHGLTITTYSLSPAGVTTTAAMPNLDLKAERTKSWEAGLDLVMFNNRLRVNATLYSSQTYNQFFNINLPSSSGYTSTWVNGGRVDNRGVELTARYTQPLGPITWETYLTWTLNRNKIKELLPYWKNPVDGEVYSLTELDKGGLSGYKTRLVEGGTLSDIYVNQLSVGEHGEYYVDPQSHTLRTDDGNYTLAGSAAPRYNLSWGNELTFKRLTLGFQLAYRNGGIVVSQTQAIMDAFGASQASADAREAGGVMINGMLYPAADYYQTVASSSHVIGSQYVYSATNLRLSEVSLSYDVPVQRWQRVIKGLTLSLVGHNLLLLYCKAPFDPELTANTGTYGQGLDYFMQPSLRTMGCSVKLRF